jgi:phenylpropionate dioxygenase-like ring-hydroxylating dioxygenase large terminal subunit
VKAFKNACRHRGVRLANGPGQLRQERLRLPVPRLALERRGRMHLRVRQGSSARACSTRRDRPAPGAIDFWAGCAFINFDDNARPLRETLGPVKADRMDARNADKLKMDWWYGTVLPTNWKLAMEAFQEGYHTMQTHPQLHAVGVMPARSMARTATAGRPTWTRPPARPWA